MITDVLSNDANRQITYGAGSNLNIPGWRVATKTGTSEPYEQHGRSATRGPSGITPDIAVGVWVGNSDNSPMVNIFSTTIAGATWHDVIVAALEGKTPRDFVKPAGIVEATVCVPSGIVKTPQMNCPTVTGMFAQDALSKQTPNWWGGQLIGSPGNPAQIPEEITGWKRTLAQEYQRSGTGAAPRPANANPPPQLPPPNQPPPPQAAPTPQPTIRPVPTPKPRGR